MVILIDMFTDLNYINRKVVEMLNYKFVYARTSTVKMATIPTTLVISTKDPIRCPLKMVFVVVKQIFR